MNSNATTRAAVSQRRGPATTKTIVETLQMKTAVSIISPLLALLYNSEKCGLFLHAAWRGVCVVGVSVCYMPTRALQNG